MTTLAFNKPVGMLCQFSDDGSGKPTLANAIDRPDIYPAGRLDADSEGLVILTDDGKLQSRITQPGSRRRGKLWKTYLAQVERVPDLRAMQGLRDGVSLKDGVTRPAKADFVDEPEWLWERDPPIRVRRHIPTRWIELQLCEGRNRQVRRMTAAVGHPTLRLVRVQVGPVGLEGLAPGEWREIEGF